MKTTRDRGLGPSWATGAGRDVAMICIIMSLL